MTAPSDGVPPESDPGHKKVKLLGRLAAGIALDFNNLLTALQWHLEVAAGSPDAPSFEESLKRARLCAERAIGLSKRLLEFSGSEGFDPRTIGLDEWLVPTESLLRSKLRPEIDLSIEVGDRIPPVNADPVQLEQALLSLALHAQRGITGAGRLTIRLREFRAGDRTIEQHPWVKPGDYALLEVEDSGPGIPLEDQARLFEPFASSATAEDREEVGLSIVYGIVKQHRGYIHVDGGPGSGTTFRILLPSARPSEAARGGRPRSTELEQEPTVLVVEDEDTIRELVSTALEKSGFRVLSAGRASEAEEVFNREQDAVDLLLTDIVLPGRSGCELADSLRRLDDQLKVIYTSGYRAQWLPERLVPEPGSLILEKPYTLSDLTATVRKTVRRS